MKVMIAIALAILLSAQSIAAKLPYESTLAQSRAIEFAPNIISTEQFEINAVFNQTGDNVIFARCSNDFKRCTMMESSFKNGQWQAASPLPFSSGKYLEADAYYNEDFSTIYFVSNRPTSDESKIAESVNLWRVEKNQQNEWLTPQYLASLSSNANDLYPSITNSGDLFFPSFRDNKRQMYVAKKLGDDFAPPKALPSEIFGASGLIGDTVVIADGQTMIISMRRDDSIGKGDLYVSHFINGKWTQAKTLGKKVNTEHHEFTPIVSPDGNYLFFTRIENGVGNIYQIALSALNI